MTQPIYEIRDFLTPQECDAYIELIKTNREGTPFTTNGRFSNNKWESIEITNILYRRLLKTNFVQDNKLNLVGFNTLAMSGHYRPGDIFDIHTDTGLYYNPRAQVETGWTLLVYLNDDFEGGNTIFYDSLSHHPTKTIIPERGKALIFDIDLWHKGEPIVSGEKYWIGCEFLRKMISNPQSNH